MATASAVFASTLAFSMTAAHAAPVTMSGTVFRDHDQDGSRDSTEPGVAGIEVVVTRDDGATGTTVTGSDGNWTFPGDDTRDYRVEFRIPDELDFLQPGPIATPSTSSVVSSGSTQMTASHGYTRLDFGIARPADYCDSDPDMATPCYVFGSVSGSRSENAGLESFVITDTDDTNELSSAHRSALHGETGSVYGVARNPDGGWFTAAYVKRHVGLTSGGTGQIFAIDTNGNVSPFVVIPNTGADTHPSNNATLLAWMLDTNTWDAVGKRGLGDIDTSDDGSTLYAMNLNTKTVYPVDISAATPVVGSPVAAPTAPSCASADSRPFALTAKDGKVYAGVVCSQQSTTSGSALAAYVFSTDQDDLGSTWTLELTVPLDGAAYPRKCGDNTTDANNGPPGSSVDVSNANNADGTNDPNDYCGRSTNIMRVNADWQPWLPSTPPAQFTGRPNGIDPAGTPMPYPRHSSPMLTDIEFDAAGNMILGLRSRFGDQTGNGTPAPGDNDMSPLYQGIGLGDILKACQNPGGGFTIENNGSCGGAAGGGVGNGEGPGGGEFFDADDHYYHDQLGNGGLAMDVRRNRIYETMFDPFSGQGETFDGGIVSHNPATGARTTTLRVFNGTPQATTTAGKANGLGDLELECNAAPIRIGERVWYDANGNGIQDPDEAGIDGIAISLVDGSGSTVSTFTTVLGGIYQFLIQPNTAYTLRFDVSGATGLPAGVSPADLVATATGQGNGEIDSDLVESGGVFEIDVAPRQVGHNTQSLDAGFSVVNRIGNLVWLDTDDDGNVDPGEPGIDGVDVTLFLDRNGNGTFDGADLPSVATTTTSGGGAYWFGDLSPGTYFVAIADGQPELADFRSSTGSSGGDSDNDDNGDPATGFASVSGPIVLTPTGEPTGETSVSGANDEAAANAGPTGPYDDDDSNLTVDFGFFEPFAIGNHVWADTDNNGFFDPGELSLDGVLVNLLDGAGNPVPGVPQQTTSGGGRYVFDELPPGNYIVEIDAANFDPGGVLFGRESSTPTVAGDTEFDEDDNGTPVAGGAVRSGVITLGEANGEPTGEDPPSGTVASDANGDLTVDFGFYVPANYGDRVFYDADGDGIQDAGEPGIADVTVELYDDGGNLVGTTTTGPDGTYLFADIDADQYRARFVLPTGAEFTTANVGGDDLVDSDAAADGFTDLTTIDFGETDLSWDAGVVVDADIAIEKQVLDPDGDPGDDADWYNADDLDGEGPFDDRALAFLDGDTATYRFVVTNTGDAPLADITIDDPALACGPITVPGTLAPGATVTVGDGCTATVSGPFTNTATVSATPVDGAGDPLTDFLGLPAGELDVDHTDTASTEAVAPSISITKTAEAAVISPDAASVSFSIEVQNTSTNLTSLENVVVTDGDCVGGPILTGGDNAPVGTLETGETWVYSCEVARPAAGWGTSYTNTATVAAEVPATDADGYPLPDAPTATDDGSDTVLVADLVIAKQVREQQQNAGVDGGPGPYVSAETVRRGEGVDWQVVITNEGGSTLESPVFDDTACPDLTLADAVVSGTDSAADGTTTLSPGEIWTLTCETAAVTATVTNTATISATPAGEADPVSSEASATATPITPHVSVLLELFDPESGTFVDADTVAGTEGAGSPAVVVPGGADATYRVTVYNTDSTGAVGDNLTLGDVDVVVSIPGQADQTLTVPGTLAPGASHTFADITVPATSGVATASVTAGSSDNGGEAFGPVDGADGDQDANDSDPAELLVSSLAVKKFVDTGDGSGFVDAEDGDVFPTALLNAPLDYRVTLTNTGEAPLGSVVVDDVFPDCSLTYVSGDDGDDLLEAGETWVYECTDASGVPSGDTFRNVASGAGTPVDGAGDPIADPVEGNDEANVDLIAPASVGDLVFDDQDRDGIHDAGEPGVPGVVVNLLDAAGNEIATTTTDADGLYSFTNLFPGDYIVEVEVPATYVVSNPNQGGDDTVDSDIDPTTGRTPVIELVEGENDPTWDAGISQPVSLGDRVFEDLNGNGQQDPGEPGLPGVLVALLDGLGNVIGSTVTDGSGNYLFDDLDPGFYAIRLFAPAGYVATLQNVGDDTSDSDIDGTLTSDTVLLAAGDENLTVDAGLVRLASLGDYVWNDLDRDGQQGDPAVEPPVAGVTVNLLDATGTPTGDSTVTDADGFYEFTELRPGTYGVQFSFPLGYTVTVQDNGDDGTDSDVDPATNQILGRTLLSGQNDPTNDAGIYQTASLGDRVFRDLDADGIQDPGEPGIEGVVVTLLDGDGNPTGASTVTDVGGFYEFVDLVAGDYIVEFTVPDGFSVSPRDVGGDDAIDSDIDPATGRTGVIDLADGEIDTTNDAGLFVPAGIGDVVFEDLNGNGVQDAGEPGIPDVTVNLRDADGNVIDSTVTDGTGAYTFPGLGAGTYSIEVVAPAGHVFTAPNQGGDDAVDSDVDPADGTTGDIVLGAGTYDDTIDAGLYRPASLGDYVWLDRNRDGQQGDPAAEPPVAGVEVALLDAAGNPTGDTTTTDADGFYEFTDLAPGTYGVAFTVPAGYDVTTQNSGDDATDSDADPTTGEILGRTLVSGQHDPTNDLGLFLASSLGDFVWRDLNGDGVQDAGEPGVEGVTVNLLDGTGSLLESTVTDAVGFYEFTGLFAGDYIVEVVAPAGFVFTDRDAAGEGVDSDVDPGTGRTAVISLGEGVDDLTWDAGILVPASVGDFVFEDLDADGVQDPGESGLSGVTVELLDVGGNVVASTVTDADGFYEFGGLDAGTYAVRVVAPAGFEVSPQDQGGDDAVDSDISPADGTSAPVVLAEGAEVPTLDAGLYRLASLGDYVWLDRNRDGQQGDPAAEPPVAGVTVDLLDATGTPTGDSTVTDADGFYEFTGLVPGTYGVAFTVPAGYSVTTQNSGDDATDSDADPVTGQILGRTLVSGQHDPTNDLGLYLSSSLGDVVFYDADGDGIQDADENGVEGVTVNLLDGDGNPLDSTTTDAAGFYEFIDLEAGDYIIEIEVPAGHLVSPRDAGGDDAADSDIDPATGRTAVISLGENVDDPTWDAGIVEPVSIGDRVFEDLNANGIQDDGEPGVPGAIVALRDAAGGIIATDVTDADGNYSFTGLLPGTYSIGLFPPGGFLVSPVDQGADDAVDSDIDPANGNATGPIVLRGGDAVTTVDAGVYRPASLGDYVWLDRNRDGQQGDPAAEPGLPGISVELFDGDGNLVDSTTTDADGFYEFTGLTPGDYVVDVFVPVGYVVTARDSGPDASDSDIDPADGRTGTITLISGQNDPTNDAGLYRPSSLGDFVWRDLNGDGVQDAGEPGVEGVTVNLLDGAGNLLESTVTDAVGFYEFTGLFAGDYIVEVVAPAGFVFTDRDAAGEGVDSDVDPGTGRTAVISLGEGVDDLTWDAGILVPASVGDFVFEDLDADGVQDPGESGLSGVTVELLDVGGNVVASTVTDADGFYEFGGLDAGTYAVRVVAPAGFEVSPQDQGGDDAVDSDISPADGTSAPVVLAEGAEVPTLDAGLYRLASLGDYVWLDRNRDGQQGDPAAEPPVEGVVVALLDAAGDPTGDTTTTDAAGFYEFTGLVPGTYGVAFTVPAGYSVTSQNSGDDATDSDADPVTGQILGRTLVSGQHDPTNDLGLYLPSSLGDFVFRDLDGDGVQDPEDTGIPGVTVNLLDGAGNPVDSTTTDSAGMYEFTDLEAGDYIIEIVVPDGFTVSPIGAGGDDTVDSDIDLVTGRTPVISLGEGVDDPTWDAGLLVPGRIGDFVFEDLDADGIQDADEPGIGGITVNLLDVDGNVIDSTTTDADGLYEFVGLGEGTYAIQIVVPADHVVSPQDQGGDDAVDSDIDATGTTGTVDLGAGGDIPTLDAGLFRLASLGDYVWLDRDRDGQQGDPAAEPPVEGVEVALLDETGAPTGATTTTDAAGFYEFTGLVPGTYGVAFTVPAGYVVTTQNSGDDASDSDADPTTGEILGRTLVSGQDDPTNDLGLYLPSSLGDYVWNDVNADGVQDPGEDGLAGVTVNLLDGAGNLLETTTTDAVGFYEFTDLFAGDYIVEVVAPDGSVFSPVDATGDTVDSDVDRVTGRTTVISLGEGVDDPTWDAGIYEPASIAGVVFTDSDADGIQDAGEPGVEGVTVNLLDGDGNVVATTTTDADGVYVFDELGEGTYVIEVVPSVGHVVSPQDQGGDDTVDSDISPVDGTTAPIVVGAGDTITDVDAGEFELASLGDYVWLDRNRDGQQDDPAAEPPVEGIEVALLDAAGDPTGDTTTTDAAGFYEFTELVPGTYGVAFTVPDGYVVTTQNSGDDATDSDADPTTGEILDRTLVSGQNDPTNDLGLYLPSSLGDYVWLDLDTDGIQDADENGIAGITVNLLDGAGNQLGSTTTDGTGFYEFAGLFADDYIVEIEVPAGYSVSPQAATDDANDSDIDPVTGRTAVISLGEGVDDPTWDAGIFRPAGIGDFVFEDLNANGIQDADEPGIAGITVNLLDADGNVVDSTTTDADGLYAFVDLPGGTYAIGVVVPDGYIVSPQGAGDDAVDSDIDPTDGTTATVTIVPGDDVPTLDAGLYRLASLGDYVWLDRNRDGQQGDPAAEPPVEGIEVALLDETGAPTGATTTTDAAGFYEFTGLVPGTYGVAFTVPAGYVVTTQNSGDDVSDSDADPTTGQILDRTLVSGQHDPTNDLGLYLPSSLGDYVWNDVNADGVQDADEDGLAGVTVNLLDGAGNLLETTTTDAVGFYEFTELFAGDYIVEVVAPDGSVFSPVDATDDTADSDVDRDTGRTTVISLGEGVDDPTWDAGIYVPASIGDFVWHDLNGNGVQDADEPGLEGVTVLLKDGDGNILDGTTTDADGAYLFDELGEGTYVIDVVPPGDYQITLLDQGGNESTDSDISPLDGTTAPIVLAPGDARTDIDGGLFLLASLGDYVWLDRDRDGQQDDPATEPGLEGIVVNLLDGSGVLTGDSTTTDADGFYEFTGLVPGTYGVEIVVPDGYTVTVQNVGADATDSDLNPASERIHGRTLVSGQDDPTNDAGLYLPSSLGDYVWNDVDADGIQDADEDGLAGVTVNLLDGAGNLLETTTTDAVGFYEFTDLFAGDYIVEVVAPDGSVFSPVDATDDTADSDVDRDTGRTTVISLGEGVDDPTWDAGIYVPASIGDFVWHDLNADGVQDADEPGLENVTVNLLDADGNVVATTTTDADGAYLFDELGEGTYVIEFVEPDGGNASPADVGGNDATDSDGDVDTGRTAPIVLSAGDVVDTIDAGFYALASLGDYVWLDRNRDGQQGDPAAEPPVEGIEVALLDETGAPTGATTTTDADGFYEFTELLPGTYGVAFTVPDGYTVTTQDSGDDATDSDADPATGQILDRTLVSGQHDPTNDLGLYLPSSLGDIVWLDLDADGIRTDADSGVPGVTVNLLDGDGNPVATTTTAGDGSYLFDDLLPGSYIVEVVVPDGYLVSPTDAGADDTVDSDIDPDTGRTDVIVLGEGVDDLTWDAGIFRAAGLGDFVWHDLNADGVQDPGEPGIEGITVNLLDSAGNVIDDTVTDENGLYLFSDLGAGSYTVQVVVPDGWLTSPRDAGGDDAADSDIDPLTGTTPQVTLGEGQDDPTLDAGLYALASLGDYIWLDRNRDGQQGDQTAEPPLEGITVNLLDENGVRTGDATVTDEFGYYEFTDLEPGTYGIEVVVPDEYRVTAQNIGSDATDSDLNPESHRVHGRTLTSGQHDPTIDAGLYLPSSIGDFVWNDLNGNGIQDPGEPGIGGVEVTLYFWFGTPTGLTTVTDENGYYLFDDLFAFRYRVGFDLGDGRVASPAGVGTDPAADSDIDETGLTAIVELAEGEHNGTIDAGVFSPSGLGDFVFEDLDGDGIQDPGEPGIPGVTVTLLDGDGNEVATTVTDANGRYEFDGLPAGTYTVTVDLPDGFVASPVDQIDPDLDPEFVDPDSVDSDIDETGAATVELAGDSEDVTVDAGAYRPVRLGDYVWNDTNRDGIQGDPAEEPPVEGVAVALLDSEGNPTGDTTVTDEFGFYEFTDLAPGTYGVEFTLPDGFVVSPADQGDDDDVDSDAVAEDGSDTGRILDRTLQSGDDDPTNDLGIHQVSSIGDVVFEDLDGDGIQDPGEPGIPGVVVNLLDENGDPVATTTTDADGAYEFDDLFDGTYIVEVVVPDGWVVTPTDAGLDDSVDSDVGADGRTAPVVLGAGESVSDVDAGLYRPSSIGGTVFDDVDGDGIQDPEDTGVPGVTIILVDENLEEIDRTVTDENGDYVFDDLPPGTYGVEIVPPDDDTVISPVDQGDDDTVDSDADPEVHLIPPDVYESGDATDDSDIGLRDRDIDLQLDKTVLSNTDTEIVWSLVAANVGIDADNGPITITDEVPASVTVLDVDGGDAWTCEADGNMVTCTLPAGLGAGEVAPAVLITTTMPAAGVTVSNTASVASTQVEPVLTNNDDTAVLSGTVTTNPTTPPPTTSPAVTPSVTNPPRGPLPNTGAAGLALWATTAMTLLLGGLVLVGIARRRRAFYLHDGLEGLSGHGGIGGRFD